VQTAGLLPVASQIAAVSTFALATTALAMSLLGSDRAAAISARLLPSSSSGLKLAPDVTYLPPMLAKGMPPALSTYGGLL